MQEAVKNTEILIPFIFYDGTNIPAGTVKVKKGDPVWLFLDRCRKVGAELGVGGANGGAKARKDNRREWARIGVDDLMLVRGEIIIPHVSSLDPRPLSTLRYWQFFLQHYEFYYFIANRVPSFSPGGGLLFDYSNTAPPPRSKDDPLSRPSDEELEGADKDPTLTKVVDRRWYERNKHIFPASLWREYEPGKEFEEKMSSVRRDAQGNAFFFWWRSFGSVGVDEFVSDGHSVFFRVGISSDPIYSEDKIFFVNRGLKSSPVHQDRCGKTSKTREGSQFSCTQLQHARVMMIFVGCVFKH